MTRPSVHVRDHDIDDSRAGMMMMMIMITVDIIGANQPSQA